MASTNKLARQFARIARLPHDKNDFMSESHWLSEYPEVECSIVEQAAEAGFKLVDLHKQDLPIRSRRFEIQTHNRSVGEHTDDVPQGVYFGLLPVGRRRRVRSSYESDTWLHFRLGRKNLRRRMEVGSLIVFNPCARHSLVYYGEETTFMLFCLVRQSRREHLTLNIDRV